MWGWLIGIVLVTLLLVMNLGRFLDITQKEKDNNQIVPQAQEKLDRIQDQASDYQKMISGGGEP